MRTIGLTAFVSVSFEFSKPSGLDDPFEPSSDAHDRTVFVLIMWRGRVSIDLMDTCGRNG